MNIIEQLKVHEGFRDNYYQCTGGKKTIGYGRNIDDNPFSPLDMSTLKRTEFFDIPMTEDEAEELLCADVLKVIHSIQHELPWDELSEARKAVCINMAFQIGISGFLKFKKTLRYIQDGFYSVAAIEMLDSSWAMQTPGRAQELSYQMSTGEFK